MLVLEKKIFKIFSVFLLFCDYLPLEKGNPLHLNNLESPPLVPSLVKIGPVVLEKKSKMLKFTDRQTDDGQKAIRIAHLSFQLR
jgi:hypothetical protein